MVDPALCALIHPTMGFLKFEIESEACSGLPFTYPNGLYKLLPAVCSRITQSLSKMAQLIGQAMNKEPRITLAQPLLGEVTHYVADITKARELLDYDPKVECRSPEGVLDFCGPNSFAGTPSKLFRNLGNGKARFEDISLPSGIA